MAKKKSNPHSDTTKPPKPQDRAPIDDIHSEKLDSLKSLNAMLLKETVERRNQVDSLTQANSALESELTRCNSELSGWTEQAVMLEIEKGVANRFVEVQVVEMVEKVEGFVRDLNRVNLAKSEIERVKNVKEVEIEGLKNKLSALEGEIGEERFILSRVCEERDAVRAQVEERVRVENALRVKVDEAEKRERDALEKLEKFKGDYDGLVEAKASVETKMESVVREKALVEKRLVVLNGLVDRLKMDVNKISEQKKLVEDERDVQEKKKNELQSSVDGLNELVRKLEQGKAQLVNEVVELEKKCVGSLDKEVKMRAEFDVLAKEKQEMEVEIERLTKEKSLVAKDLDDALNSLRKQNLKVDQLDKEKTKIIDAKNQAETDVIKLKEQLEELKNTVKTLEKVSIAQTDKINELEAEKSRYIAASDQATKERNNVRASLDGEKEKVKNLTEKISKIEKDMEDMQKKLSKMQKETEKLVAEKKDLEKSRAVLEKDILAIKKSLAKTQKDYEDTEGKLKVSEANSRKILKILKNTSSICNSKEDKNKGIDKETAFGEEIKHHVTEVEAIKKAFKEKESVADEMKKQLELLKVRVAKADKGKSFWTMVSSATTLLAAVSLAYVARGGY
ncbi:hypothetical protein HanLR1_Chr07g0238131 [Helianthus annuus]|nr:hypothetical protein HanLR1_Chr07g0238131 [Helianthus annuus]